MRISSERWRQLFVVALFLQIAGGSMLATPRIALLSGTRCSACHYNPQGAGIRTELGWSTLNEVGLFKWKRVEALPDSPFETPPGETPDAAPTDETPSETPDTSGTTPDAIEGSTTPSEGVTGVEGETSEAPESNSFFGGKLVLSADARLQYVKIGRPPSDERLAIPMQTQIHAAVVPTDWLVAYGGYNFSGLFSERSYPAQSDWEAAVQIHPSQTAPSIRLGFIQPSIGVRQDDHTFFTRREVARSNIAVIPPMYNEWGAEITYEGLHWLTASAGVFSSEHLREAEPSIVRELTDPGIADKPSFGGRLMFWPQLLEEGINGEVGASALINGDFQMINAFAGFGLADKSTLFIEAMYSTNVDDRRIRNVSVMGSYLLAQWLSVHIRYEFGQTERPNVELSHANMFVLGAEFFPLPYIEIRPEYRYFENDAYRQGQYTVQLHLFY